MKTTRITVALAFVLMLLVAIPVSAAAPIVETGTYEQDYMPFGPSLCPGIEVWDHEVGTYRMAAFYDNKGNLLEVRTKYSGTDNFYNPANPGVVLSGDYAGTIVYDARTGRTYGYGLAAHITMPGYGTVLLRAGNWSAFHDEQRAGKDSFDSAEDMEQFCSYLAGN